MSQRVAPGAYAHIRDQRGPETRALACVFSEKVDRRVSFSLPLFSPVDLRPRGYYHDKSRDVYMLLEHKEVTAFSLASFNVARLFCKFCHFGAKGMNSHAMRGGDHRSTRYETFGAAR